MQKLHPVVVVHGQVPLDSRTTYTRLTDCSAVLFRHHLAPSNIKYLHVLLLTEQSLLAATEQSLWAAMLSRPYPVEAPPLAPSSIPYLHVWLLTRKPFLAAMLTSVVSCLGTVPGSQQHQVHLHLFWFTRKTFWRQCRHLSSPVQAPSLAPSNIKYLHSEQPQNRPVIRRQLPSLTAIPANIFRPGTSAGSNPHMSGLAQGAFGGSKRSSQSQNVYSNSETSFLY